MFLIESQRGRFGDWFPLVGLRSSDTRERAEGLLRAYLEKKQRQSGRAGRRRWIKYRIAEYVRQEVFDFDS